MGGENGLQQEHTTEETLSPGLRAHLRPGAQRRDFLCVCRKNFRCEAEVPQRAAAAETQYRPLFGAVAAMGKRERGDRGETWRGRAGACLRSPSPSSCVVAAPPFSAAPDPAVSCGLYRLSRQAAGPGAILDLWVRCVVGRVGSI